MNKHPTSTATIIILLMALAFIGNIGIGAVKAQTQVNGIITQDTTWTKAGSPYTLTGPVAVNKGVTLTIEPGTSVSGDYYLQINGTLIAIGSNTDPISMQHKVIFTAQSTSWCDQNASGSIIEHASLLDVSIIGCSPRIDSNDVGVLSIEDASPTISNNSIFGEISILSSGDNLSSPSIVNNDVGGINVGRGSPIIMNNNITSSNDADNNYSALLVSGQGTPVIAKNLIQSRVDISSTPMGVNRLVYPGVVCRSENAYILDNVITGCSIGISAQGTVTIERNLITGSQNAGIELSAASFVKIQNNTITYNSIGIQSPLETTTIAYNNLNNNGSNVYLTSFDNVNATDNWWGTTDIATINQTIHDLKDDFNLGSVNFGQFLAAPNPNALPDPNQSTPTINSTPTPTSQSNPKHDSLLGLNGVEIAIIVTFGIIIVTLIISLSLLFMRTKKKQNPARNNC